MNSINPFIVAAVTLLVGTHAPNSPFAYALSSSATTTTTTAVDPITSRSSLSSTSFSSRCVVLNGVEHRIRDTGVHPDVADDRNERSVVAVMAHGLGGSADSWEDVAPILYEKGRIRCVAVDRVGFGLTERPKRPSPFPIAPPVLPGAEAVARALEESVEASSSSSSRRRSLLPDPRRVLAGVLRRPETAAPVTPWSGDGGDPYSADFAVKALWPLLDGDDDVAGDVYFVGHSAGAPLALRALREASATYVSGRAWRPAGAVLVAPAVLDPTEDPDAYDADDDDESDDPLAQAPPFVRRTVFRAVLSLPDAVGLPLARGIYEGRDLTQALLEQFSPETTLDPERVKELVRLYAEPVERYPDDWDVGLLNVYRSSFSTSNNDRNGAGRALIRSVPKGKRIGVLSGRDDPIVPARAARKIHRLIWNDYSAAVAAKKKENDSNDDEGVVKYVEMKGTGHLPMHERPKETARHLLGFMLGNDDP